MKKQSVLLALSALLLSACTTTSSTADPTPEATATPEATDTPETTVVEYRDIDVDQLVADGASLTYTTVYGVYNQEGESPDSSIKTTVYVNDETKEIEAIEFVEALLPISFGGAQGWGILDEETAAALNEATVTVDESVYPTSFELGGIAWTGAMENDQLIYSAEINGETTTFMDYIATDEGGAWYHEAIAEPAKLLDGENAVAEVKIETKESIEHGVGFWPSDITFPGNLELIKNYVYDNGVEYGTYPESDDIAQNENGEWVVLDTNTHATLAGAPNYFNLVKEAYDRIMANEGTAYTGK